MMNKDIPRAALTFSAEVELGDNGPDAKTAPFKMLARTGLAIEHWYWGKVAHDLSGMKLHKERLPVDFNHDPNQVVGYLNKFNVEDGNLQVSGAIVPYKDGDKASEILHMAKEGVPWEASINFGGDGIEVEEIPEGESSSVNGYDFSGPGVIIRKWPLRGVAVVPYGADQNTHSLFSQSDAVNVLFKEPDMDIEVVEDIESVEATEVEAAETETEAEFAAVEVEVVEATPTPGAKFLQAFGDKGGVWFAEGRDFDECQDLYRQELQDEVKALRERLSQMESARGETPVSFSNSHNPPQAKDTLEFFANIRNS